MNVVHVTCVTAIPRKRIKLMIHPLTRKTSRGKEGTPRAQRKELPFLLGAVGPVIKLMPPDSNRINMKYEPYSFK